MPEQPLSEFRKLLMTPEEVAARIHAALRVSALVIQLNSVYSDLIKKTVFSYPLPGYDPKELKKHKKQLLDEESYSTLLVAWRESGYVLDEHLEQAKLGRHFTNGAMTAYGFATKIAESPDELARTSSRIRSIAMAAEAFGLLERESLRPTNRPLIATERLHQFILTLTDIQLPLIAELHNLLSLRNVGLELPQQ